MIYDVIASWIFAVEKLMEEKKLFVKKLGENFFCLG